MTMLRGRKRPIIFSVHIVAWTRFIGLAITLKIYAGDWIDRLGFAVSVAGTLAIIGAILASTFALEKGAQLHSAGTKAGPSSLSTANQPLRRPLPVAGIFFAKCGATAMEPNEETFLQMCILGMIGVGFLVLAVAG